jgi:hypothetical protein
MAKAAFNQGKKTLTSKLELNLRKKIEESYIWSVPCMMIKLGNLANR